MIGIHNRITWGLPDVPRAIHFNDRKGERVDIQNPLLRASNFLLCIACTDVITCGYVPVKLT
jgi:hypothetical protein